MFTTRERVALGASSLAFLLLFIDALINPYAAFDIRVMLAIQHVHHARGREWTAHLAWLTGTEGAILSWLVVLAVFVLIRRWAAALATSLMPFAGLLNTVISDVVVGRQRPHLPELVRRSTNWAEGSFPSGHVMGAVILYGFVFVVGTHVGPVWLRLPVRTLSLAVIAVVGVGRIWQGAHWPSDVFAAYALGFACLIGLVALERHLRPILDHQLRTRAIHAFAHRAELRKSPPH